MCVYSAAGLDDTEMLINSSRFVFVCDVLPVLCVSRPLTNERSP